MAVLVRRRIRPSPYLHRTYAEVLTAFETPSKRIWLMAGIVALAGLPFILSPYYVHLLNLVAIAIVGAVGLNLVTGWAGQVSLGHAAFVAVGAYVAAAMTLHLPDPFREFLVVLPAAGVAGAVTGALLGLPALRLRGLYLALGTIAFHYVLLYGARRYHAYLSYAFTQTSAELVLPPARVGTWVLANERAWYYFLLATVVVVVFLCTNLARTRAGRAWLAVHHRDLAAAVIGVDVVYYKVLAFVLSAALAAIAGCLAAYYERSVSADNFTLAMSIQYLAMVVIGGMASIVGSILGAFFVTLLPYVIRLALTSLLGLQLPPTTISGLELGLFGLLMWLFLRFEPEGLAAIWVRARQFVELWPFTYRPLERRER